MSTWARMSRRSASSVLPMLTGMVLRASRLISSRGRVLFTGVISPWNVIDDRYNAPWLTASMPNGAP